MNRAGTLMMGVVLALLLVACGGSSSSTTSQASPQSALKSYDLAWAEGNANEACKLLADQARTAVETEMSNRTLSGLPLNCPARMKELLELIGPAAKAQLRQLAERTSADSLEERGGESLIQIAPGNFMGLTEIAGAWYIVGGTIGELEPLVVDHEKGTGRKKAGTVDAEEVKEQLPDSLGVEYHEELTESTCPEEVPALAGEIFTCDETTASGKRYQAELEVIGENGAFVILRQEPNHEY